MLRVVVATIPQNLWDGAERVLFLRVKTSWGWLHMKWSSFPSVSEKVFWFFRKCARVCICVCVCVCVCVCTASNLFYSCLNPSECLNHPELSVFWCHKMKTVSPSVLLLPETKSDLWSDTWDGLCWGPAIICSLSLGCSPWSWNELSLQCVLAAAASQKAQKNTNSHVHAHTLP